MSVVIFNEKVMFKDKSSVSAKVTSATLQNPKFVDMDVFSEGSVLKESNQDTEQQDEQSSSIP